MMTMALSTNIPIATMKAPNEMRCKVVPHINSMGNDTAMVNTRPKPMMAPLRNPIVNTSTRITINTDSSRFSMNEWMASSTLSGWKNIFSVSIPAGTRSITLSNLASTNFPTSGTIASDSMAKQMANAGLPSTKKPFFCGSVYVLSIRAMSPSRSCFPSCVPTSRLRMSSSSVTVSDTRNCILSSPFSHIPALTVLSAPCRDVMIRRGMIPLRATISLGRMMLMTSSRLPTMLMRFTPFTESSSRRISLAYFSSSG